MGVKQLIVIKFSLSATAEYFTVDEPAFLAVFVKH